MYRSYPIKGRTPAAYRNTKECEKKKDYFFSKNAIQTIGKIWYG